MSNASNANLAGRKDGIQQPNDKEVVTLTALKGDCAYFGFSDYYVMELAKKRAPFSPQEGGRRGKRIYDDIERKLKIALLFFDKIIHSADVIRDQDVYGIFKEYKGFIREGMIEFIHSSSVGTVDYHTINNYVVRKRDEGEKGLGTFIGNTSFADNVVELLNCTKRIVHRGYKKGSKLQFLDLVKKDLEQTQVPQVSLSRGTSTLFQILFSPGDSGTMLPNKKVRDFKETVEDIAAGENYSRQHILEDYDSIIGDHDDVQLVSSCRSLVEERLCLLYANLNASTHFIIDFHHEREKCLPFRVATLDTYLNPFTGGKIVSVQKLSPTQIASVRKSNEWHRFIADYFLSYSQWTSRQDTDVMNEKREILPISHINDYSDILAIIGGGK